MRYKSTKVIGPFSAAFRQHNATSHCRLIHGYGLTFKFTFGAHDLDLRNWVVDFGGLRDIRTWLEHNFDHKLLVARDDPRKTQIVALESAGVAHVRLVDAVGCEAFAEQAGRHVGDWLVKKELHQRVRLLACEVREHDANSAIYSPWGDLG